MSDSNTFVANPQEASRSVKNFEEVNLTRRDHQDPDLHFIGDGLPVPSLAEVATAGINNAVGTSPFPARANHGHDVKFRHGQYNHLARTFAPGSVYFNDWSAAQFSTEEYKAAGQPQIFVFPQSGLWDLDWNFQFDITSGNFAAGMNIVAVFNSFSIVMYRNYNGFLGAQHFVSCHLGPKQFNASDTLQVRIDHNEAVNVQGVCHQFMMTRIGQRS
jgi:hypothetical protein